MYSGFTKRCGLAMYWCNIALSRTKSSSYPRGILRSPLNNINRTHARTKRTSNYKECMLKKSYLETVCVNKGIHTLYCGFAYVLQL